MILQQIALNAVRSAFGSFGFSGGGPVGAASGGFITGPGTGTSDSIPARLSDGEYVVRAAAVKHYGPHFLEAINRMALGNQKGLKKFVITRPRRAAFQDGGFVNSGSQTTESAVPPSSLRIINVPDMEAAKEFANSSENETVILNVMRRNAGQVKQYLR